MVTGRELGLPFFFDEPFTPFHARIHESDKTQVFVNLKKDFAKLHPTPTFDYQTYVPRSQKLGTADPKKQTAYMNLRLDTTLELVPELTVKPLRVLEIGTNDGSFMKVFCSRLSGAQCEGVEPSEPHRQIARESNLTVHADLAELKGQKFDMICMFHTFEHFLDPIAELRKLDPFLAADGSYVIEIPSLTEPLLSLYEIEPFKDFYFQAQHPYVYSPSSLRRLLETHGYQISAERSVQRYGLGNHLQWLRHGKPGEFAHFSQSTELEAAYIKFLVERKQTDTLFVRFSQIST